MRHRTLALIMLALLLATVAMVATVAVFDQRNTFPQYDSPLER